MKPLINQNFIRGLLNAPILLLVLMSSCGDDDNESPAVTSVTITSMVPQSPANLVFYQTAAENDRVTITYNYNIVPADGGRIWVQPYTNGSLSDDYLYSQSSVYQGSGNRTVIISIDQGSNTEVNVDQLRVIITDPDQTMDLFEDFIDVDYTFTN